MRYTAQLIARIIISHHGLHDWWTDKCKNYYKNRCSKQERYKEINDNIKQFISDNELNKILIEATNEYSKIDEKIQQICNSGTNTISLVTKAFYFGMQIGRRPPNLWKVLKLPNRLKMKYNVIGLI